MAIFVFFFSFFLLVFSFSCFPFILLTNAGGCNLVRGKHEQNNAISRTIIAFVPSNRLRVALKSKHRNSQLSFFRFL